MIKAFLGSLKISRKSPEGKKGAFIKSSWKWMLVLALAGCSYHSITEADVEGKNIRYPMGFKSIKGDAKVHLRREMSVNRESSTDDKYLTCLTELNQCVIENKKP